MPRTPKSLQTHTVLLCLGALCLVSPPTPAQGPQVTAWRLNLDGATGSSPDPVVHAAVMGIPVDVQQAAYDPNDVWIRATTVPSHSVGPFLDGNPNLPGNNNTVYRITRNPTNAGLPIPTPLGSIGTCVNGVPVFNPRDGRSYFNLGIWNQNAIVAEAPGFDPALGHPAKAPASAGLYHYHQPPPAVLVQEGDTGGATHSPLIGFAFDGYPLYGPYGHASPNGTGGIVRIQSSYRKRNITLRNTGVNGMPLPIPQHGPPVSPMYPLGYYVEDFEYVPGLGHLDEYNGRQTVTPEFPGGTYAYYATIDATGQAAYPYLLGPNYRGIPVGQTATAFPPGLTPYRPQVQKTGAGCSGFSLTAFGNPTIPNPAFEMVTSFGPPNGGVAYIFSRRLLPIVPQVLGCPIFVDVFASTASLSGQLGPLGGHRLALPIPGIPALAGQAFHLQSVGFDPSNLKTSNAVTLLLR